MKSDLFRELLNDSEKELLDHMQNASSPDQLFGAIKMSFTFQESSGKGGKGSVGGGGTTGMTSHWSPSRESFSPSYSLTLNYPDIFPPVNPNLFTGWTDETDKATEDYFLSLLI